MSRKGMTTEEKQIYSLTYQRQMKVFERKYIPQINSVLQEQVNHFAKALLKIGPIKALHEINKLIFDPKLAITLSNLYKDVGVYFGKKVEKEINKELKVPVKKTGQLGSNPQWIQDINDYLVSDLLNDAVIPINNTTRNRIREILAEGQQQGYSYEEIARLITGSATIDDEMLVPADQDGSLIRARLITRTESVKAAFVGRQAAASKAGFQMQKEWIAAEDFRTRPAHAIAGDSDPIDEDALFNVMGEDLIGPGDPNGSAANTCNCRCTLAYTPKRNAAGRLIRKQ